MLCSTEKKFNRKQFAHEAAQCFCWKMQQEIGNRTKPHKVFSNGKPWFDPFVVLGSGFLTGTLCTPR